jgi:hypothetical protein
MVLRENLTVNTDLQKRNQAVWISGQGIEGYRQKELSEESLETRVCQVFKELQRPVWLEQCVL